ncbi:hypothetical protein PTI98_012620 [Pleurotus ostreatus]|nr:hypothetical protein PTI98_012620 [Pleurotus ostreatus]
MSRSTLFRLRNLLLLSCLSFPLSYGTNASSKSPRRSSYDYIVVGGGTAGNVVAARLTEDPKVTVLLLEAGVSNEDVLASEVPLLGPSLVPNSIFDWNYTTTAQAGYNGRVIPYPRGRMLGGSSSVNYMVFMRGSSEDFDSYAAVTGDCGWKWDNMQQYIRKSERVVPPADRHNTTGQFLPELHGTKGAINISLPGFPTPLDSRVLATLDEQKEEFSFNPDMGGGDVLGVGWTIQSIGNGQRSSSATSYLKPAQSRPNLEIMVNAQVTKLVQTGTTKGRPAFRCVQFTQHEGAPVKKICATGEVVLSAGSIGTPLLLQLSGIGDGKDLRSVGIKAIVNNPSVGRNLSDHILLASPFAVNGNRSFDPIFRTPSLLNDKITLWTDTKTGPLVAGVTNHLGWLRLPSNASIFETVPDPASGPNSPHWEIIFSNLWVVPGVPAPATGSFMSISSALISPTSRGFVKLASSNPFTNPIIDPQFLSTEFDVFTMVEAVKANLRFISGKAWADYVQGPFLEDLASAKTDADFEAYVRNNAGTIFHPVGTASMSPRGAGWGVVDPDLKVKGVDGLRIVDGSVLPHLPSAHTQGPIYLVGERGADLIKASQY